MYEVGSYSSFIICERNMIALLTLEQRMLLMTIRVSFTIITHVENERTKNTSWRNDEIVKYMHI